MNRNFNNMNQTRWTPEMQQKLAVLEQKLVEETRAVHFYDVAKATDFAEDGKEMDARAAGTLSTVLRARGWRKTATEVVHERYGELVMSNRWVAPGLEVAYVPVAK